jgi:hypothetical protein
MLDFGIAAPISPAAYPLTFLYTGPFVYSKSLLRVSTPGRKATSAQVAFAFSDDLCVIFSH